MAFQPLTPLDMTGLEIQNFLVQNLASAPGSPGLGQMYTNSVTFTINYWNNTRWVSILDTYVTGVTSADGTLTAGGTATAPTFAVATGGITNTQINASAAIAYSKLNLGGSIVDNDISNSAGINASKLGGGSVTNTELSYVHGVTSAIQTQLAGKEVTTNKGVASGYASLDGSGKVPIAQLPSSLVGGLAYQGVWNASTNSPALVSGVGTLGFYYKVSVAGTTSIDGNASWEVGDWIVFDGTVWDKVDNYEAVTSVAGRTGAITLTVSDVSGALAAANNLSDLASAATARTNLGLGSSAVLASTTFLQVSNNLSDLANAGTARTNLGLGTSSTHAATDFLLASNNLSDVATPATARSNIGAIGHYEATIGNGTLTTFTINQATHGLAANKSLDATVYNDSTNVKVYPDVAVDGSGNVTVTFTVAPTSNQFRVKIKG